MRALSLWQPWASVIFEKDHNGVQVKPDETRHWATRIRGRIAIHAAKKVLRYDEQAYYEPQMRALGLRWAEMPFGCIIGTVEFVRCSSTVTTRENREPWQHSGVIIQMTDTRGNMNDPRKLTRPIPWRASKASLGTRQHHSIQLRERRNQVSEHVFYSTRIITTTGVDHRQRCPTRGQGTHQRQAHPD